jgi:hypothetical protein
VDIVDYGIWRQHFGETNCGNVADLNRDCRVDIRDYATWRANFGLTEGAAGSGGALPRALPVRTATPAPASLLPPRPALATDFGPPAPLLPPRLAALTHGVGPPADRPDAEWAALADDWAAERSWSLLRAEGSAVAVPVIPEADSLGLLLGSLGGFGLLVGWRMRRRR